MWFAPIIEAVATALVAALVAVIKEHTKKEAPPTEKPPPCTERTIKKSGHKRKRSS
jgi:hypothetical protein